MIAATQTACAVSFSTDLGWFAFSYEPSSHPRMQHLTFGHPSELAATDMLVGQREDAECGVSEPAGEADNVIQRWVEMLSQYAAGEAVPLSTIPIDDDHLTPFGRMVLSACREIPYGSTRSYGQLAEQAGRPGAARAVGSVMANNRTPLVAPCHRVLGAGGKLGGFSAPQGTTMKRRLLDMEQQGLF